MEKTSARTVNGLMHGVTRDIEANARAIAQVERAIERSKVDGDWDITIFEQRFELYQQQADLMRERSSVLDLAIANKVTLEPYVDDGLTDDERLTRSIDLICAQQ